MNILYICPVFYPAWEYGGIVPASFQIANELSKKGVNITVYATDALNKNQRQKDYRSQYGRMEIYYFKNLSNILAWNRIFLPYNLNRTLLNNLINFDIVHLWDYRFIPNILFHMQFKKCGVPYVVTPLNPLNNIITGKKFLKLLFDKTYGQKILCDASILIAQSYNEAKSYIELGIPKERIRIIPNGFDIESFSRKIPSGVFRKRFGIPEGKKIILYLGRIHYIKGIDRLIYAFSNIIDKDELKSALLVIAGPDAGYLTYLRKYILSLGLSDRVIFTGSLIGENKLCAFKDADVFVLPSRYEEFGIAPLEAYACGTPIVITENCGVNYWMKDHFDFVVDNNTLTFEDALINILNDNDYKSKIDTKKRLILLEKYFSNSNIATTFFGLYSDLCRTG